MREHGIIEYWNAERGYGFIHRRNGQSIFFHVTDLTGPPEALEKGVALAFEPGDDPRTGKPRAVAVEFV